MVCGRGSVWACGRLGEVTRLLDSATGGLQHLWHTCAHDHAAFTRRLTDVLDAILPVAIPDVDLSVGLGEGAVGSPSSPNTNNTSPSSTTTEASPATEASEVGVGGDPGRRGGGGGGGGWCEDEEDESLRRIHRIFNTAPLLQLPKSGGAVFLRAQQVVEACQQQRGVLAGATMHKHRVLNTQMPSELTNVLAALSLSSEKDDEVLQEQRVEFALPSGVRLSTLHLPSRSHASLLKFQPKCGTRRSERYGLHSEETSLGLSSFRSVLQTQQSLNAYPSSLPITIPDHKAAQDITCPHQPPSLPCSQPPLGHNLLAKISGGIASELRPSQSLPGSPRKIRVTATHPDVGGNSPDLRYKVLTGRKPRPPSSTNSSPRRLPGGRTGMARTNDTNSARRVAGLCPPNLTRGERRTTPTTDNRLITKMGYDSEKSESGYEDGVLSDSEVSLKNTKNRLNLHLAPDKINAPNTHIPLDSSDPSDEPKITREINGNHKESGDEDAEADSEEVSVNGNQREESDRSEDSDISVLDLAKFIETKENGDRQLAEAVRGLVELTTRSDDGAEEELTVSDDQPNLNHIEETRVCESHGCEALAVYRQQHHNTSLLLLLAPAAAASPQLVYTLWRLGISGLTDVQQAVERALEVAESGEGGDSFLQWSPTALMASSPAALNTHLIDTAHQDFRKHRGLMEVTLRSDEAVTWSHRHSCTETFYQVNAQPRPGLPIPSDVMAKVPHRARRRLDRDHNITLL
ncbi:hypothetical protein Pmani_013576 [Petrolisthes manimaculis]|uniref:Uncharacterized protein n=1 Tax=Petrolisthes manimaculis TaxID=1843537 RepID=A0AAE1PX93_9EUCA|nr:hypothetical protein Pmani_013576 [Petrolisthes manimaculis]